MIFTRPAIPGVVLVTPAVHGDARGHFMEVWHAEKFAAAGLALSFIQDNQNRSRGGTLRGLRLQIERPKGKLVYVGSGDIFDVAVGLRSRSPTFQR
jgi:dTDP-4-dehydrorhamnose 3,5-epimerase